MGAREGAIEILVEDDHVSRPASTLTSSSDRQNQPPLPSNDGCAGWRLSRRLGTVITDRSAGERAERATRRRSRATPPSPADWESTDEHERDDCTAGERGGRAADEAATVKAPVSTAAVWRALAKASFAVVSHVNAAGEPRSSGVVYAVADRRLYVAVAADGWKARQIVTGQEVAVTVPVRRGGILALLMPIPPATITFHATATVHPAGSLDLGSVSKELLKLLRIRERRGAASSSSLRKAASSRTASAYR